MRKITITMTICFILVAMMLVGCAPKYSPTDETAGDAMADVVEEAAAEEPASEGLSPLQDNIASEKEAPEEESYSASDREDATETADEGLLPRDLPHLVERVLLLGIKAEHLGGKLRHLELL